MSLLGDDIKNVFGEAFGAIYLDGTLHTRTISAAANGDLSASADSDIPIKCQVGQCTKDQREEQGYTATDVAIYILQKDIATAPAHDHEITAPDGVRYGVGPTIRKDSANSYWLVRGSKVG